jgi:hypothetical protein
MVRSQPEDEVLQLDETIAESGSHLVDLTTWDALLSPAFWVFAVSAPYLGWCIPASRYSTNRYWNSAA